jgi:hypothetical protein
VALVVVTGLAALVAGFVAVSDRLVRPEEPTKPARPATDRKPVRTTTVRAKRAAAPHRQRRDER